MSTLSTVVAPLAPRGFVAKAGTLAAGTALAGAALFGGVTVAPTISSGLAASVQHDFALTAAPTFEQSLQTLLDTLQFGTMGQVLGVFGSGINVDSSLGDLLGALNPGDALSLDDITGGLLSQPLTALLNSVDLGAMGTLATAPVDDLVGLVLGGDGADTTLYSLMDSVGLGAYAGLLDLPFLGLDPDTTTVADLLGLVGIGDTTSLSDLLGAAGSDTIAGLLGINAADPWNEVLSGISLGEGSGALGDLTLSNLLGELVGDTVTNQTTVTDFLGDLGIFDMLGLG